MPSTFADGRLIYRYIRAAQQLNEADHLPRRFLKALGLLVSILTR